MADPHVPADVASRWSIDLDYLRPVAAGRNSRQWRGETASGVVVALRRYAMETTEAEAGDELRIVELLRAHGIPVPAPIPTRDGEAIVVRDGLWSACEWIDGRLPGRDDVGAAAELGRVMARVHAIAETSDAGVHRALAGFADTVRWDGYTLRDAIETLHGSDPATADAVAECAAAVEGRLASVEVEQRPSLVHGDLHPLNVLVTANGIVVLDWAFARWDDPMADLGVALRLWPEGFPSLLTGYREVRPVSLEEESVLPVFAAARGLDHLADRLTRWLAGLPVDIARELEVELADLRLRLPTLG